MIAGRRPGRPRGWATVDRVIAVVPAALVFDFDGTLVDTETAEYESVRQVWATTVTHYELTRWTPWVGGADAVPWLGELEACWASRSTG